MATKNLSALNDTMFQLLQKECFTIVTTVNPEEHTPYVNAISWIYAPTIERIVFAVDTRSQAVENIKKNENVSITLIGDETTSVISGEAFVVSDLIESVPIKLALVSLSISGIRDAMFYGAKISQPPQYEKTYDARAAAKLDKQVMTALKTSAIEG